MGNYPAGVTNALIERHFGGDNYQACPRCDRELDEDNRHENVDGVECCTQCAAELEDNPVLTIPKGTPLTPEIHEKLGKPTGRIKVYADGRDWWSGPEARYWEIREQLLDSAAMCGYKFEAFVQYERGRVQL